MFRRIMMYNTAAYEPVSRKGDAVWNGTARRALPEKHRDFAKNDLQIRRAMTDLRAIGSWRRLCLHTH